MKDKILAPELIERQYAYMARVREWNPEGLKAHILTFGCQQNEADSERIAGMAVKMGYTLTDTVEEADLIVINTCAVREHAELKALSITGNFKHLKKTKKSLVIAMCGCMVSQEHRKDRIKSSYPYVDFVFGTTRLYTFPEILFDCLISRQRKFYLDAGDEGNIPEGLPVVRMSRFKAWVSIMYGCNNFCTYCVVPYVRGRERSRHREEILKEIEALAKEGYREITLLGQNVNSYGKDLYEAYDFADLLSDICRIEGNYQLRFMTSHPKDASYKLIDVMAREEKIAKFFHLPLQSGSNRILKEMNRHYTREHYLELVRYMREKMPDISISTDIIVGFPGETEEDFADTLSLLREVQYDNIYSFLYSKRVGTKAAVMDCQIPDDVKGERFERLLQLQNEVNLSKNRAFVGKTMEILVEGQSKTDKNRLTGRSESNRLVHFEGDSTLIGKRVTVRITEGDLHALFGELI
ncbi:MAG: tRNA (N6-isopentenyl adenosine(37)-C2)-methylthiotransferase MiaB [Clostridia bacterium]|nr:tRNA (N6-isopentenyl adenosine(37)-C2)-methylthiotransferase MiaB [Clostridia bacterium]